MRNEVPCGKLPKARSDGRHSPFSTARNDGGLKEFRSVVCAQLGVCWGTGSTSMENFQIRLSRGLADTFAARDYDIHGPAGPTAFWKESDELEEEKDSA